MTSWVRFHKHLLEFTETSSNYSFIYNVLLDVESMQQCLKFVKFVTAQLIQVGRKYVALHFAVLQCTESNVKPVFITAHLHRACSDTPIF